MRDRHSGWRRRRRQAARGGAVAVRIILNAPRPPDTLKLRAQSAAEGVAIQSVDTVRDVRSSRLRADPSKVKVG